MQLDVTLAWSSLCNLKQVCSSEEVLTEALVPYQAAPTSYGEGRTVDNRRNYIENQNDLSPIMDHDSWSNLLICEITVKIKTFPLNVDQHILIEMLCFLVVRRNIFFLWKASAAVLITQTEECFPFAEKGSLVKKFKERILRRCQKRGLPWQLLTDCLHLWTSSPLAKVNS